SKQWNSIVISSPLIQVLRSNQIFIRDSLKLFPITHVFPLQIQISLDSTSGSTPTLHSNPHTEIEWSPARVGSMDTVMHKALMHPQFAQRQSMSFDDGDDLSSSSSRRNSSSEKARQTLLAQRRQSNIQVSHSHVYFPSFVR
ncbi:hypothetical protein NECAME_18119, partial [Necator americanus]